MPAKRTRVWRLKCPKRLFRNMAFPCAYETGSSFQLLTLAQRKISESPPEKMAGRERAWIEALLRKIVEKHDTRPMEAARAERLLGEIALACGEKQDAATHFRSAIGLDPEVGVRRLLTALERGIRA